MHRNTLASATTHARPIHAAALRRAPGGGSRLALAAAATVAALLLTACGGGDDAPTGTTATATAQITGVAATGAPIAAATVRAVNAAGATATATTGADGSYTLSISEGAPYALTVTDGAGAVWYSYARAAGTAHITPLTTLALLDANNNRPLADLVAGWATARLADAAVLQGAQRVNANLRNQYTAAGADAAAVNVFNSSFSANHTGLDAVLDGMRVAIRCNAGSCSQTITDPAGQTLVQWSASASTTGISLSWTAGTGTGTGTGSGGTVNVSLGACSSTAAAGTYSLVVQTSVAGLAGVAIPEVCVDGLPGKPTSQAEFCGDAALQQQLPAGVEVVSCSYSDPVGTITARVTTPVALDYSIRYTFVQR